MRRITWVGIGLLGAGLVLGALDGFTDVFYAPGSMGGYYRLLFPSPFLILAGVLFLVGIVLLGVSPPPMGAMKVTGITLIIVGLVGFFVSLMSLISSGLPLFGFGASSGPFWPLVGVLLLGLLWGPVLMVIGLGLLLVTDRRERAAVST